MTLHNSRNFWGVKWLMVIEFLQCLLGHLLLELWASRNEGQLPCGCHAGKKPEPHRKAMGQCPSWHSQSVSQGTTSVNHQTITRDAFRGCQPAAAKHPSLRIFPDTVLRIMTEIIYLYFILLNDWTTKSMSIIKWFGDSHSLWGDLLWCSSNWNTCFISFSQQYLSGSEITFFICRFIYLTASHSYRDVG